MSVFSSSLILSCQPELWNNQLSPHTQSVPLQQTAERFRISPGDRVLLEALVWLPVPATGLLVHSRRRENNSSFMILEGKRRGACHGLRRELTSFAPSDFVELLFSTSLSIRVTTSDTQGKVLRMIRHHGRQEMMQVN